MSKSNFVRGMELYRSMDMVELKIRDYGKNNNNYLDYNDCLNGLLKQKLIFCNILKWEVKCKKYLQNLKIDSINGSISLTACLSYCNNDDCGCAVLLCGHSMCENCTWKLTIMDNSRNTICVTCPFCNIPYGITESTIFFTEIRDETQMSDITSKRNVSIKMESITLKLMELITKNPTVKILIVCLEQSIEFIGRNPKSKCGQS